MGILLSLIALSLLILIHEWGHYYFAKKNGVKVLEFAIGFPPKIWSFIKDGTRFAINLIPFGGYVKLYGEDAHDPKILKDKKSFASKSSWQKTQIILGGVLMNFLVFWMLSSIAFTLGMNPMLQSEEDLKYAILDEKIQAVHSVTPEVSLDAPASEYVDLKNQKISLNVDGHLLWGSKVLRNVNRESLENFGLKLMPYISLPTLHISDVSKDSVFVDTLQAGDKLLQINGLNPFDINILVAEFEQSTDLELLVLRDGEYLNLSVSKQLAGLVVAGISETTTLQNNDLQIGDRILALDDMSVESFEQLRTYNLKHANQNVNLKVLQENQSINNLEVKLNSEGQMGVYLSKKFSLQDLGLNFWIDSHPFFLDILKKDQYPFYQAPWVALSQAPTFAVQTVSIFLSTISDIFTKAEVSNQVGGPLKVVSMGSLVLDQGLPDFFFFFAIISLSLAVLNILPIPALDGGRLLFVIIEVITKKPINPKIEAVLHLFGFIILMAFIIIVTIFDIIRF